MSTEWEKNLIGINEIWSWRLRVRRCIYDCGLIKGQSPSRISHPVCCGTLKCCQTWSGVPQASSSFPLFEVNKLNRRSLLMLKGCLRRWGCLCPHLPSPQQWWWQQPSCHHLWCGKQEAIRNFPFPTSFLRHQTDTAEAVKKDGGQAGKTPSWTGSWAISSRFSSSNTATSTPAVGWGSVLEEQVQKAAWHL